MKLSVALVGNRRLLDNLERMPAAVRAQLLIKVSALAQQLKSIIQGKLDGVLLKRVSGRLYDSITATVYEKDSYIEGLVTSEGVPYAFIQDKGGTTPAHIITPKNAQVLAFAVGGKMVFARQVNHPGSTIPAKDFMMGSYREMSQQISRDIKNAVVQGIRETMRAG